MRVAIGVVALVFGFSGLAAEPLLRLEFGTLPSGIVVEGDPVLVQGPVGKALEFDGRDDRIVLPEEIRERLASLAEGTIAFWFRFEDVLFRQAILPIFYLGMDDPREPHNLFVIEVGHRNPRNRKLYVTWVRDDRVVLCFDTGFNLEPGRWYHFALVVSDAGNTGYLNGRELGRRHYNFGHPGMSLFLADVAAPELCFLGYGKTARGKSPRFLYFAGALDDFRIYDRPLSEEEIAGLYALGGSAGGEVLRDIVYREVDGAELKLDLYLPTAGEPPYPVVVHIHGGGWTKGHKGGRAVDFYGRCLLDHGIAVASVDYRLAPRWRFPAMIEDVKCAVRFLRARAREFGLDPERFGAFGTSAGGHLAALLRTLPEEAFSPDCFPGVPSRVQAVADFYGPTDLTALFRDVGRRGKLEEVFGAETPGAAILREASPIYWASPDDPPFLLVHGDRDPVVPLEQSLILYERLVKAGVPAELVVVENASHGFAPRGGEPVPSAAEIAARLCEFFVRYLAGE